MVMTNAERQRKFRENKLNAKGKHFRLQTIINLRTHTELERLVLRLNKSKQDVIAQAIHDLSEKLGYGIDEWEKEEYQ